MSAAKKKAETRCDQGLRYVIVSTFLRHIVPTHQTHHTFDLARKMFSQQFVHLSVNHGGAAKMGPDVLCYGGSGAAGFLDFQEINFLSQGHGK
jgi:hypothetical protein